MPAPPASPNDVADDALPAALLDFLRSNADETDRLNRWPGEQLRRCAEAGVTRWFAPPELGGVVVAQADVLRRLTHLAAACLTTTFCLTQPTGVIGRFAACDNDELKATLIPELLSGRRYASVDILDGVIPWSTGAQHSAWIVTGAVLADGRQLLAALPTDLPGVTVEPPADMVGLSATCTGAVRCDGVLLDRRWLMAPVMSDVLKFGKGAGTGGLQTSALALGTALAAINFLHDEAGRRPDLARIVAGLREQWNTADAELAALAEGQTVSTSDQLRRRANELALRSAQAALAAAKGSGYVVGHPAGRWCREALFFLVWSCPEPVTSATLCELAKIE